MPGGQPVQHSRQPVGQGVIIVRGIQRTAQENQNGREQEYRRERAAETAAEFWPVNPGRKNFNGIFPPDKQRNKTNQQGNGVTLRIQFMQRGQRPAGQVQIRAAPDPDGDGGGHGRSEEIIFANAPQGVEAVAPADFFPLGVGAPVIGDGHFVNPHF